MFFLFAKIFDIFGIVALANIIMNVVLGKKFFKNKKKMNQYYPSWNVWTVKKNNTLPILPLFM